MNKKNIKFAEQLRHKIMLEIIAGNFDYSSHFPDCPKARILSPGKLHLTTVSEATERWLRRKELTVAESTFNGYKSKATYHIINRWGNRYIKDVGKTEIRDWIDVELHHLSNKTINDVLIVLRGVFSDYKDDNPSIINPLDNITNKPVSAIEIDPFTLEEIRKIVEAPTKRISERNMIEFAIWSGLSLSEFIALAWEDIDLAAGEATIRRARVRKKWKSTKEEVRVRKIELTDRAKEVLTRQSDLTANLPPITIEVIQSDNKTVRKETIRPVFLRTDSLKTFDNDFTVRDRFFKTHLKRAGVRYRGPNNCRHTYASQMLTSGIPKMWVADQMGHSNTDMIDKHYGKWIREDSPGMAELASRLLEERETRVFDRSQTRPIE